jgi:hypothetical protein
MANQQPSFNPASFGQIIEQYLADELPGRYQHERSTVPGFGTTSLPNGAGSQLLK